LSKVKVFKLAKEYGFKSAEFVDILRNIGFPVTSYQASVEEWDVPVIHERLVRGGLIEKSAEDKAAEEKKKAAAEGGATPSWADLLKAGASGAEAEAEEEPVAEEQPEAAAEEPEEPTPVEQADEEPVAEPAAAQESPAPPAEEQPVAEQPAESLDTAEPAKAAEPAPAAEDKPAEPVAEEKKPEPAPAPKPAPRPAAKEGGDGESEVVRKVAQPDEPPPTPKPRGQATRVGRIDLAKLGLIKDQHAQKKRGSTFTDLRERENARRRDERQKQREKMRERRQGRARPKHVSTLERKNDVVLELPVTVKSFSTATGVGVSQILGRLMGMGLMSNINAVLDEDTVELLAEDFNIGVRLKEETNLEAELMAEIQAARHAVDEDSLGARPPVIAFLGHVDHGKTSLIDAIRTTRVANKEAGGITQHVGAYMARTKDNRTITILDTPGHEAFTAMRRRGARATDIVVLVVAADDGVMPQTEEAAAHAKAAGTPIVVAINKCDVQGANPDQVRSQLSGMGLQDENWGGDVGMIEVSALKNDGIDTLLERVLLESEVMDLKAHTKGDAIGVVLEAKLEKGRGKVASVLVQDGTLNVKDAVLAGPTYGKIRLMFDHNGKPMKTAGPSTPVDLLGLDELPPVGETLYVVDDLRAAKNIAEKRELRRREQEHAAQTGVTQQNLYEKLDESQAKRVRVVLKGDVQGSVEVLRQSLRELSTEEVIVDVVHSGVGGVTESDVLLGETADAMIIAFNVVPEGKARKEAERVGVDIRRYNVIYELLEDVQKAVEGLLTPDVVEAVIGHAEVLQVFRSSRWGSIAGCRVVDGVVKNTCRARLVRDGKIVYEAPFSSLRHFKDDVREVKAGNECGIKIQDFEDIKPGDIVEAVQVEEVERTLEEAKAAEEAAD
jgi:translation initiation factor IF-2